MSARRKRIHPSPPGGREDGQPRQRRLVDACAVARDDVLLNACWMRKRSTLAAVSGSVLTAWRDSEQRHAELEEGCGHKYFMIGGRYFVKRAGLVYPFYPHPLALVTDCTVTRQLRIAPDTAPSRKDQNRSFHVLQLIVQPALLWCYSLNLYPDIRYCFVGQMYRTVFGYCLKDWEKKLSPLPLLP
jgi:hypothetical protein